MERPLTSPRLHKNNRSSFPIPRGESPRGTGGSPVPPLPSSELGFKLLHLLFFLGWTILAGAAEQLPPVPPRHFNDYAKAVSGETADRLNQKLEQFERDSSSQILVAIFSRLPPNAALEDYTLRVAEAWKPGLKTKDNGAILFVFPNDRRMRIEVGYGLEGVLPDSIAKRIIEDEIRPQLAAGNFDAGMTAGVNALLQAARGEYQGTGRTAKENRKGLKRGPSGVFIFIFLVFMMMMISRRRGTLYNGLGRTYWGGGGWGGGWSGGGGSSSSGGLSGGGGGFGGGGASGSW